MKLKDSLKNELTGINRYINISRYVPQPKPTVIEAAKDHVKHTPPRRFNAIDGKTAQLDSQVLSDSFPSAFAAQNALFSVG